MISQRYSDAHAWNAPSPQMTFHKGLDEAHLVLDARIIQLYGHVGAEVRQVPETRDIIVDIAQKVGYDPAAFVQLHERQAFVSWTLVVGSSFEHAREDGRRACELCLCSLEEQGLRAARPQHDVGVTGLECVVPFRARKRR